MTLIWKRNAPIARRHDDANSSVFMLPDGGKKKKCNFTHDDFSPPAEFCPAEQLWPRHRRGSSLLKGKGD